MVNLLVRFDGAEERFQFVDDVISLGRVSSNSIQVKDVKASRNHCELRQTPDGWKLVDLESSNGTSLNGNKVNTASLKPGDVIAIGKFEVVFEPDTKPVIKINAKSIEPIEKTVVDTDGPKKEAAAEAPAMAAAAAASQRNLFALATKGVIAAAVLIAALVVVNKYRAAAAEESAQRGKLSAAMALAKSGEYDQAMEALEALIVSNPLPEIARKAATEREHLRAAIAKRDEERSKAREAAIAELNAAQQAAGAASRFESAVAQIKAYLANGDFGSAMDEVKRYRMEFPGGTWAEKIAVSEREVLSAAGKAWEELTGKVNSLTAAEKYGEALAMLGSAEGIFAGTRFAFEVRSKLAAIQRLSGVSTTYASAMPEMSAQAQESFLAVNDLVRARSYEAALKAFDRFVGTLPEKDRAKFAGRRSDIEKQSSIFRKLMAAINAGQLASFDIELGGGVKGHLSEATADKVTMDFKDQSGKGGTTGRRWFQVPATEMLSYFKQLALVEMELIGLAAFCYDNKLPLEGADILHEIAKSHEGMASEVYGLVARVRGIGVPADGFVYFERGWYTKVEYTYAKLDYKARKGAALVAKVEDKPALEGYGIYKEMVGDESLTPEFKATVTAYYVKALKEKRQAIMRSLQASAAVANFRALQDLKKELNKRRAEALRIIYDKTIYPDENHGVEGQPVVDDAVALVRELWDKPLKTVVLDVGVKILVESGQQTNGWLKEMGEAENDADLEEFENLMSAIGEKLHLRNVCLDSRERKILEYNRKVWKYNEENDCGMSGPEIDCIRITNEYREMQGREILQHDEQLGVTAEKHSAEMVAMGYFAHESPVSTRRTPMDRAKLEGYAGSVGENIATGYGSAQAAFNGWYNSSGHHRNMLSDGWNHIGLGCVNGSMWTENLGRGTSHLGEEKKDEKTKPRGGVDGGEGKSGAKDDVKPGERAAERGNAPKQPDGKCIGTEPFNPDKDKKQGDAPEKKDEEKPEEKKSEN